MIHHALLRMQMHGSTVHSKSLYFKSIRQVSSLSLSLVWGLKLFMQPVSPNKCQNILLLPLACVLFTMGRKKVNDIGITDGQGNQLNDWDFCGPQAPKCGSHRKGRAVCSNTSMACRTRWVVDMYGCRPLRWPGRRWSPSELCILVMGQDTIPMCDLTSLS